MKYLSIDSDVRKLLWSFFYFFLITIILGSLAPVQGGGVGDNDKIFHFFAYLILALPLGFLKINALWKAIFIGILIGLLLEVCQHFIPGRQCDILDLAANSSGSIVGSVLALIIYKPVVNLLNKSEF